VTTALHQRMNVLTTAILGLALLCASAAAQAEPGQFPPDQIKQGAALFTRHCATCHGTRMRNPQWAIDLRTFPRDAHNRFVDSVTNGKRNMPPWDDVLQPADIEALWAYVVAGEPGD
jgi:mono/diheme cytochrome c family protein